MNFVCSLTDIRSPYFDLTKHKTENGWSLYLDRGWTKTDNYFYKGFSGSWCKIYVDPIVRIETNKLRDFPIYHSTDTVSNFLQLENTVPVDGIVEIADGIQVKYQEDFFPRVTNEVQGFKECHDLLYDAVIENVGTFAANNKRPIYIPKQGGIDSLTVRSVFDFLNVDYKTFDMPNEVPKLSKLGSELAKHYWGFTQVEERDAVIATGFYGDEWILRNPLYVHMILSQRDVDIVGVFDNKENCYMKNWFDLYRDKCKNKETITKELLITQICNDFQIWHLHDTYFFNPLKHISLLTMLSADTQTIIDQVTDAKLSRSIIEKCNPELLSLIEHRKNQNDPIYFGMTIDKTK